MRLQGLRTTVLFNIADDIAHRLQLLGLFIGHLYGELLLKGHHQLDGVEGVGPKVFYETGLGNDLLSVYAKLVDNDITDFIFDGFIGHNEKLVGSEVAVSYLDAFGMQDKLS